MLLKLNNITINIETYYRTNALKSVIFLHGFTGSSEDWKPLIDKININFNLITVDLIGHGKSSSPREINYYSSDEIANQINEVIKSLQLRKIIIGGYSMGGRAALTFTEKFPKIVDGLILESSTAGIENEFLRSERAKADEKLSEYILNNPLEKFIDYWMNLDLFLSQKKLPKEKLQSIKDEKMKNDKVGLANSLKGFSTGKMPPLFDQLKNLKMKTLLITGELDKKFTKINCYMEKLFTNSQHVIIKNAGHNTHLEQPEIFVSVLNDFLNEF